MGDALKSNKLKPGECVRLMYSIGKMLSLMPQDQILPRLEPILSPYLQELNNMSNAPPAPHAKPNMPVQVLFPQIYPIIKRVAEKWYQDSDVIECMCNLLNQCVQTLQDNIRPLAD